MRRKLVPTLASAIALGSMLFTLSATSTANAYETTTIFKTEHFAINQVILGQNERLDGPLQASITGDIQAANRLDRLYQSTTVVFPYGSVGYNGKINTPIQGVLTIANYNTGKDRILFNNKAKFSTDGGLYLSFAQMLELVNQKQLQQLYAELKTLPLVITDVTLKASGYDPTTKGFYVTAINDGIILDVRIDDSVYYDKSDYQKLRQGCKVNLLTFIDRIVPNIPLFISGRAAVNAMDCSAAASSDAPTR